MAAKKKPEETEKPPRKSPSGTVMTYAERKERGRRMTSLTLDPVAFEMLQTLADEETNGNKSLLVERLIFAAGEARKK